MKRAIPPLNMAWMHCEASTKLGAHISVPTVLPWFVSEASTPKGETIFGKYREPRVAESLGANIMQGVCQFHAIRSDHTA